MGLEDKHRAFTDVVVAAGIPPFYYRIFPLAQVRSVRHVQLLDVGYKNARLTRLPQKFLDNTSRLRSEAPRWGVIQYMLNGQMKFFAGKKEYWVRKGEAVLFTIPSDTYYYDSVDPNAEWFFVTFSGETAMAVADELLEKNGHILKEADHGRLVPMASQLMQLAISKAPVSNCEFSAGIYHILMELSSHVLSYRKSYPESVARALELIDREFGNSDFTLDELASRVGLSKFYFTRLFVRHIGKSPGAYLQAKRMQIAMEMLLHSNVPIKEVQYLCGFKKYNYFLTAFKKIYGISPGSVRR